MAAAMLMVQLSKTKMLNNNNKHPNEDGDTPIITHLKSYNKPNFFITKYTTKSSHVVRKEDDNNGFDVIIIKFLLINWYITTPVTTMIKIQGNS